MNNRALLSCLLAALVGILPVFSHAGKKFKKVSIDTVLKGKKVARYWVKTDFIQKAPLRSVPLIDLIEDIIALQPKAGGFSVRSKCHKYYIICTAQTQANMQDEQFVKLLVDKRLFIIPAVGTMIGTIGGITYRLEYAERVKASMKNLEQVELIVSVTNKK